MASYEMTGQLKVKGETQTFPSGFSKRMFVITTQEQYPQDVAFEVVKDRTSAVDKFNEGDMLKVTFDVRGREYNGKYYVNLNAYRIDKADGAPSTTTMAASAVVAPPAPPLSTEEPDNLRPIGDDDDLPF